MAADSALAELTQEAEPAIPLWEDPTLGLATAPETSVVTSEPEKKGETPPEDKKPENPSQGEQEVPLKGKARENFARLEQKTKEAEERAIKLQAEYDTAQTRLKEYEEKLSKAQSVNPEEFAKKEQEYQTQLQTLQNELKFAALERDPDFIARFETPKTQIHEVMKSMAVSAGVDEKEFESALGNPKKMFELRDNLEPHEQYRWDAALSQIEQVNLQRSMALKNRDQTYAEINQRREAAWNDQRSQILQKNLSVAKMISAEVVEKIPAFKDDMELQKQVSEVLEGIAGGKNAENYTAEEIMRKVAASVVQTKVLTTQHEIIQGQTAEIEELKKKVEENESFIKEKFGSLPDTKATSDDKKEPEKVRPIWEVADETVRGVPVGREFI